MAITLDGSSGIASVDGSAGSPSIRGTDAKSGIYYTSNQIYFSADGAERARIDSNALRIGATAAISGETRLTLKNDSEARVAYFHHDHNSQRSCFDCQSAYATGGQSAVMIEFRRADGGSVGSIFSSTSATAFNTSSDYRLKENQVAISDGITRLKTLKPYRFNWKENKSLTVDGFFAHEVTSAVPEAITGEKDAAEMQQIDQSKLVPLLTAAMQEAITKIENLEAKVAVLEAG